MRYEDHDGLALKPAIPATDEDRERQEQEREAARKRVEKCPDAETLLEMLGLVS